MLCPPDTRPGQIEAISPAQRPTRSSLVPNQVADSPFGHSGHSLRPSIGARPKGFVGIDGDRMGLLTSGTAGAAKMVPHSLDACRPRLRQLFRSRRPSGRPFTTSGATAACRSSCARSWAAARWSCQRPGKAFGLFAEAERTQGDPCFGDAFPLGPARRCRPATAVSNRVMSGCREKSPTRRSLTPCEAFPQASIGHAYASTEAGVASRSMTAKGVFRPISSTRSRRR